LRSKEQRRTGWGTLNGRARRVRRHHVSGYKAREMGQGRARGQSLPELALVLPVVLMIVLVALDFGRLFLGWVTLNNAARVAANYGAITPTPWTAAETAQYNLLLDKETSGIDCTPPNPWPEPTYPGPLGTGLGGRANVSLTCQFHLITPVFNALFPNRSLDVSASADFPVRTGALANLGGGGSSSGTPPVASFTAVPTTGTAQLTVNFTNTSTGGVPQTWLWHFADGTLDDINPTPPAHTFVAAGTYLVTLTETNGAGNSQAQALISVSDPGPAPIAAFYGTVPSPCISNPGVPSSQQCGGSDGSPIFSTWPMPVDFTNTSQNTSGATYSWAFGDGQTSAVANPSHQYSLPGIYSVSLTVTTGNGTNSAQRNAYVNAGCVVPSFIGSPSLNAPATWTNAHFTGDVLFYQPNGQYKKNPQQSFTVNQQNPGGQTFVTASQSKGQWECPTSVSIAPTGAVPAP